MDSRELQEAYGASRATLDDLQAQALHEGRKRRNSYQLVREFMETFGHPVYNKPTEITDEDWLHMRLELIREELGELYEACGYETSEWTRLCLFVRWQRPMSLLPLIPWET